jgi:hypothetical protein
MLSGVGEVVQVGALGLIQPQGTSQGVEHALGCAS